jgi:small subunit ribosomal protein S20
MLANIQSAIKRNKQNEKRRLRNRVFRGQARTSVKKARVAIASAEKEEARVKVMDAVKALDKAASKGSFIKIMAARLKSRLIKQLLPSRKITTFYFFPISSS